MRPAELALGEDGHSIFLKLTWCTGSQISTSIQMEDTDSARHTSREIIKSIGSNNESSRSVGGDSGDDAVFRRLIAFSLCSRIRSSHLPSPGRSIC